MRRRRPSSSWKPCGLKTVAAPLVPCPTRRPSALPLLVGCVKDIPLGVSEDDVKGLFSLFGRVLRLKLIAGVLPKTCAGTFMPPLLCGAEWMCREVVLTQYPILMVAWRLRV